MSNNKRNNKQIGTIATIIVLTVLIMIISSLFSVMEIGGQKTSIVNGNLETSLVTVQNIFTSQGIKYIFSNAVTNFRLFEPLILTIMSLVGISICEKSGLFKIIFGPLKKRKPSLITSMILFISIISTIIGDYSYALLIPFVAIMYKNIDRNPNIGILTVFIGLTVGYGTGIIYNHNDYLLGLLTEISATINVDETYKFSLPSTWYIMIASTVILTIAGAYVIENTISKEFKRYIYDESEIIVSRKALYFTSITFVLLLLGVIYMITPGLNGSGILLDNSGVNYIEKLFSETSPFKDGLVFIITTMLMICGFVYGIISKNVKNGTDYSLGLSKSFDNIGFVLVLMFASSIMLGILSWTNLGEIIAVNLVEFLGVLQFSGIPLIIALFIIVIIMSILIPSTISKWILLSPVAIPLFMKSNITPDFTQFIFKAADGIGKAITPFFMYFMVMVGFLEKYNNNEEEHISIFKTFKLLLKPLLILSIIWLIILICWYIIGLPIGSNAYPTL